MSGAAHECLPGHNDFMRTAFADTQPAAYFRRQGAHMLDKIVRVGRGDHGSVFCRVKFEDGRLSITGVEGPLRNGDAKGSCGQIVMHPWGITTYAPGWDAALEAKFREVWNRWHLNDMQAGSPAQRAWLEANPVEFKYPESHYEKACAALAAAGLNPDRTHSLAGTGKPYFYGTAWLRAEVPQDVLAFLRALPDTDLTPSWV